MRIFQDVDSFTPNPDQPLYLILGNFDGLHLGHQALLHEGVRRAKNASGRAAVFTFREHPQLVLQAGFKPALLTSLEHKLFLLAQMKIDDCFLLPFTLPFSKMEAGQFIEKILVKKLHVRGVCLGMNARFGHDREGNAASMKQYASRYGFEFYEVGSVKAGGSLISSSRIRKLIVEAKLEEAAKCLGRAYSVFARVIRGAGRGKSLGYPTANLETLDSLLVAKGVYPVRVRVLEMEKKVRMSTKSEEFETLSIGSWLCGVLNFGRRPTFGAAVGETAEVFILDFEGDLYGKTLEVEFYPPLRPERTFQNPEALKKQIAQDIERSRQFFARLLKKGFTKAGK